MFLFINFVLVILFEYNISMIEFRGEFYDVGFVIIKRIYNILELRFILNYVFVVVNMVSLCCWFLFLDYLCL